MKFFEHFSMYFYDLNIEPPGPGPSWTLVGWLVGCFGFHGPLRQYFNLYWAVSQREGEREERIDESKNVQTTPTRTYGKLNMPLPYLNQNCRTPRHWKFTLGHWDLHLSKLGKGPLGNAT